MNVEPLSFINLVERHLVQYHISKLDFQFANILGKNLKKVYKKTFEITLTLEFCAQPLRHVWLMYEQIAELEK